MDTKYLDAYKTVDTKLYIPNVEIGQGFEEPHTLKDYVQDYEKESQNIADYLGIKDTYNYGITPIYPIDGKGEVQGVTLFDDYGNSIIGLDNPSKRVAWHELTHVLSGELHNYIDDSNEQEHALLNQLMETIAEYGMYNYFLEQGDYTMADEFSKTPYPWAYSFGKRLDHIYESELGNGIGLRAMVRDIYDTESVRYGFDRWGRIEEQIMLDHTQEKYDNIIEMYPPEVYEEAA